MTNQKAATVTQIYSTLNTSTPARSIAWQNIAALAIDLDNLRNQWTSEIRFIQTLNERITLVQSSLSAALQHFNSL